MTNSLISVIVPVYNGERYLSAALDSVFAQDYRPIEVIVVDDGSTDTTATIVQGYSEVRYFHQENQGPSTARNTGIAAARGEYIAFLDADDIWLAEKLSAQIAYLIEHPQVGYVGTRTHFILEAGVEWPTQLNREYCMQDPPLFITSAVLIRRAVLDQVGMFSPHPQLNTVEDLDWFARANDLNITAIVIDRVLLHRRIHDKNISINIAENMQNVFTVLRYSTVRKRAMEKKDDA